MMYKNKFVAVIKCQGSILRERTGGVVNLPFGSTYSILLKNKHSRNALVSIEVDGKDVLNGHQLIVAPNSSDEIKGWMRNMRQTSKFKFINKTKKIQRYRGDFIDDGLIRVTYQFEKEPEPVDWVYLNRPTTYFGGNNSGGYAKATWTGNTGDYVSCYNVSASSSLSKCSAPRADEGITVRGKKINQNFTYGSIGEVERAVNTIVLQLKGVTKRKKVVTKPVTVRGKITCDVCGKKSATTARFCSRCGNHLD